MDLREYISPTAKLDRNRQGIEKKKERKKKEKKRKEKTADGQKKKGTCDKHLRGI